MKLLERLQDFAVELDLVIFYRYGMFHLIPRGERPADELIASGILTAFDTVRAEEMRELLRKLLAVEHSSGGSLQGDGQFYYRVPESIFQSAAALLAKIDDEP